MNVPKKRTNPFYVLLVLVGVTFTLTACAYGVMTVRAIRPDTTAPSTESSENFMKFIDKNGFSLLMWQLGALAVFTVAAMTADVYLTGSSDKSIDDKSADEKTT